MPEVLLLFQVPLPLVLLSPIVVAPEPLVEPELEPLVDPEVEPLVEPDVEPEPDVVLFQVDDVLLPAFPDPEVLPPEVLLFMVPEVLPPEPLVLP